MQLRRIFIPTFRNLRDLDITFATHLQPMASRQVNAPGCGNKGADIHHALLSGYQAARERYSARWC